jgi:hypothetical protein
MADTSKLDKEVLHRYDKRECQAYRRGSAITSVPPENRPFQKPEKKTIWCKSWKFYTEEAQEAGPMIDLDKERKKIERKRLKEKRRQKQMREARKMYKN